ncbi:MAG: hypothetical protein FD180_3220 [Planctomycetota bacterium]|nr:MAG: hypothetical protein FD180_3220 [Planctomycetota bacterium]
MTLLASSASYPSWSVVPFVGLLLCIALLPLLSEKWWHRNRNKALVGIVFGFPVAAWTLFTEPAAVGHTALDYFAFLSLLGALFVVAGGVEVRGSLSGTPLANTGMLALGSLLANVVGTTGASMLLIRPFLRANRHRTDKAHLVVFFIFIVSNVSGLLTPLGDPPLFLGFLHGVPFTWTLRLWGPWAVVTGGCLFTFAVIDQARFLREGMKQSPRPIEDAPSNQRLSIAGAPNLLLLAAVVLAVFAGGAWIKPWAVGEWREHGDSVAKGFQILALAGIAGVSLAITPREARKANGFTWHPFVEVSVLFAGIFAAMIPAMRLLELNGSSLNVTEPWHFFWAAGSLSAFLDNAPTYLAFLNLAQFLDNEVAGTSVRVLEAISCGAVFFGAMTYIGNGPNFMVKAIADHAGVKMPSFFGYMAWSMAVLLPLFVAVTLIFFR